MPPVILARWSQGEISIAVLAQQRHDPRSPEDKFPVTPIVQDGLTSVSQVCSRPILSAVLTLRPECSRPYPHGLAA